MAKKGGNGIEWKAKPARRKLKIEQPPKSEEVLGGGKLLPTELGYGKELEANEKRRKKIENESRLNGVKEMDGLDEFIRRATNGGRELAIFALEVIRNETGEYMGSSVDMRHRLQCMEYLTDRAFGKAVSNVNVTSLNMNLTDTELIASIKLMQEKIRNAGYSLDVGTQAILGVGEGMGEARADAENKELQALPVPGEVPQ